MSVALFIQHAKRMRRIILSSVACSGVPYFSSCLINGTIFRGKKFAENKKNVGFDFLYNFFSETFIILRRIQRDVIINEHVSSCKVPVIYFNNS